MCLRHFVAVIILPVCQWVSFRFSCSKVAAAVNSTNASGSATPSQNPHWPVQVSKNGGSCQCLAPNATGSCTQFCRCQKVSVSPLLLAPAPASASASAVVAAAVGIVLNLLQKVFIGWLCATATLWKLSYSFGSRSDLGHSESLYAKQPLDCLSKLGTHAASFGSLTLPHSQTLVLLALFSLLHIN